MMLLQVLLSISPLCLSLPINEDNNEMTSDNNSDLDQQIETLRKCEVIKESDVKVLCAKAREILGKGVIRLQACRVFGSN